MNDDRNPLAGHPIVSRQEWLTARVALLAKEKDLTKRRDDLARERRALPWVRVDKAYTFDGPAGKQTLPQLFGARTQLVVYHFMFAPDWEAGCKHCSFWADNFDGIPTHLRARDTAFAAVSKHIRVLEQAGLVRRTVHGREHRLRFDASALTPASEWIATQRDAWERRLDALENLLLERRARRRRT